jgi:hypothetical protein
MHCIDVHTPKWVADYVRLRDKTKLAKLPYELEFAIFSGSAWFSPLVQLASPTTSNIQYVDTLTLVHFPQSRIFSNFAPLWGLDRDQAYSLADCDENNLVQSEVFRVYKSPIWAVKTEIVGIAPALGLPCKTDCCPVQENGGVP